MKAISSTRWQKSIKNQEKNKLVKLMDLQELSTHKTDFWALGLAKQNKHNSREKKII